MIVAVAVVAYESEAFIESVLDRIPELVCGEPPRIIMSDDASRDGTYYRALRWAAAHPCRSIEVVRQPKNLGYGGNQAFTFERAAALGADVVVLLHGDEQYPPERIADLVAPILDGGADVVIGTRMAVPGDARRGGMPLVRIVGNRALTFALNRLSSSALTEWFTGFRAYRVAALSQLSLATMPAGFDFDVALMLAMKAKGHRVVEVPIPTHYGDELSRVPLARTGLSIVGHGIRSWVRARDGRRAKPCR